MAIKTWNVKINGKPYAVKALKAQAEKLHSAISDMIRTNQFIRETSGIIGGEERQSVCMVLFGPSGVPMADPDGFAKARDEYLAKLPETINADTIPTLIIEAREIRDKFMPVKDSRQTQEQVDQDRAEMQKFDEDRKEESLAWVRENCESTELVKIPEGMMAVYAEITFDDSDMMSDYHAPHCQIGNDMLLAIVPKQAQKESLARSIMARYPELASRSWTWHTENYSMGHGNYLMSDSFGSAKRKAYNGRDEVATSYEIRFNAYAKEIYAFKGYSDTLKAHQTAGDTRQEPIEGGGGINITIRRNTEKNGLELVFSSKPEESVISQVKGMGFRWGKFSRVWYCKFSDYMLEKAKTAFPEAQLAI